VKSILNHCDSKRVPFEWTIILTEDASLPANMLRAVHARIHGAGRIGIREKKFCKKDAAPLLAWMSTTNIRTLRKRLVGRGRDHIAIGTATDPYQPAEREYRVTRACWKNLRPGRTERFDYHQVKQIVRDIDVLSGLRNGQTGIDITITTLRAGLTRLLSRGAPRPDLRLAAVKQLRKRAAVGVSASR